MKKRRNGERNRNRKDQDQADGEGFEAISLTHCAHNSLPKLRNQCEAESEADCVDSALMAVIKAWPNLSTGVRERIVAIVRAQP
jgi:hypothetical protein